MNLSFFDIFFFVLFFAVVVGVSMYKSRKEESGEDFFLAGRSLTWPFIGLSLIAANISTEQIVGQAGQGAGSVASPLPAMNGSRPSPWSSSRFSSCPVF